MATPKWFNADTYMANKLTQVQAAEPDANWTEASLAATFVDNGFSGEDGAYNHFVAFGANEDVSPNALFSADQYYTAKAAQFYGKAPSAVSALDVATVKGLINDAGMNAWSHYQAYGVTEGVNPSNDFDSTAYMEAKLALMQAADSTYTMDKLEAAFADAGYSPLQHFLTFGGLEGEVQEPSFPVADDEQVPALGDTYNLTVDRDTFTGTSQNDQFIADVKNVNGTDTATLNPSDVLDGGAGSDTLTVYGDENVAALATASISDIEQVVAVGTSDTVDLSANADVQEVLVKNGTSNITVAKAQVAGYEGTMTSQTVTFSDASAGVADAATVALNGVTGATVTVAGGIEAQTLKLNGENTLSTGFTNQTMTSLTITGDGSLARNAAGDAIAVAAGANLLKTVDASAATGDLALSFTQNQLDATEFAYTGSNGADDIAFNAALTQKATINLGADDDSLTLVGAPTGVGSTFDGGEGSDTLVLNNVALASAATGAGSMFTGFENLVLTGNSTYNAGQIEGITSYELAGGNTTIGNLANAAAVTASADTTTTLNLADGLTANGTLNITLDNAAEVAANGVDAKLTTNAHVLNIASEGMVNTDANGVTLEGTSLDSVMNVNITGDQAFALTTAAATNLILVDGSAATGKLTITATGATKALTIKGGSADDTITGTANGDTLIGGAGDDQLIAGAGADTMTGGEGKDVFTIDSGVTEATIDTVTDFVTKTDSLKFEGATAAGSNANFAKAATTVVDFAAAKAAADAIFDGDTAIEYSVQQVGDDSYVFYAVAADNAATDCVKLTGVALDGIAFDDIIA